MRIRLTKWECRRLIDILTSGVVGHDNLAWASNLANRIEIELQKQICCDDKKEQFSA